MDKNNTPTPRIGAKKAWMIVLAGLLMLGACAETDKVSPEDNTPETPVEPGQTGEQVEMTFGEVLDLTPDFLTIDGPASGTVFTFNTETGGTMQLTLRPGEMLGGKFAPYHAEHIHVHVGSNVFQPAFPDGAESADELELEIPLKYDPEAFPGGKFDIVSCYSVQQQLSDSGYTMRLEPHPDVLLYGVSETLKYKYFDCYLYVTDAFVPGTVEFSMGHAGWKDLSATTGCGFFRTDLPNVYRVTVRPDYQDVTGDVLLRVKGDQHARYKITWVNADDTHVDLSQFTFPTEALDGDSVAAEIWAREPYYIDGLSANVRLPDLQLFARTYVRFTMPAADVTLTLEFKEKVPVSFAGGDAHITEGALYDAADIYYGVPVTRGIPGESVWLFANAEKGYIPARAVNDAGETFNFKIYGDGIDRYGYYAEVRIPANVETMSVTAESMAVHYVTGENVQVEGGSGHPAGEKVNFVVYVPSGQKVDGVTVTATATGEAVSCIFNAPYGSFTMPDSDVTIVPSYSENNSTGTVHVSAEYDEDVYDIVSSTNYDWDFLEGFDVTRDTNIFFTVYNWYGGAFWVGIRIGGTASYYQAEIDDMSGEYEFYRSITASGDVLIRVGATKEEVGF